MRDKLSVDRADKLHPKIKDEVKALITQIEASWPAGRMIRITQGLRTIEEQNALYAQGRTKPGKIVTNARGGSSYHNYGLAVDLAIIQDGKVIWTPSADIVAAFKKAGYTWGGDFKSIKDKPHFEKSFGKKPSQLKHIYTPGQWVEV